MCVTASLPVRRVSFCQQPKSVVRSRDDVVETCSQFYNWSKSWFIPAIGMG
ncbi:Uncharacterised protein [Burkholderia pseudomallei]|nr:Uncharacterised protein [Burkholderia pseudomallei]